MDCVKVVFNSKKEAQGRCKEINKVSKKVLKYYVCDKCGKYHLTSASHKRQRNIKKRISEQSLVEKLKKEDELIERYNSTQW